MPRWGVAKHSRCSLRIAFDADDRMLVSALRQDPVGVDAACHHVSGAGCRMTYLITMGEFG
jgi:hypothetical protein